MGQAMEQVGDYPAAVRYYKEALALEPTHTFTWYFINNNLGFSLNTLGQFAPGEIYCRKAIEVDATRPNAHKNLGIALAGQGEHREAAKSFVTATQANAADSRAFRLLQDLLRQHPELEYEFAGAAESCQKAVEVAAIKAEEVKPVVLRGWKKHLFLLSIRLRTIWKRIQGGWR
jgi:Flp pilus assembly protein TadD